MKSIKEKQLLVKWSRAMNEDIDPALVEEVERYEKLQQEIRESIRKHSISDLAEASAVAEQVVATVLDYPKPPTLDEVLAVIKEEENELVQAQTVEESPVAEKAPLPSPSVTESELITRSAARITKEAKEVRVDEDSFQQPNPALVEKNVEAIQKKLKFLEQAIGKIAATGPGGGAVWLRDLNDVDYTSVKNATNNQTLVFNAATKLWVAKNAAAGGSGISLTDLSVSVNAPSGDGNLTYDDNTGIFAFTPADVPTATSNLINNSGFITSSSLSGYATNAQLISYATTANLVLKANITDLTTANVAELNNLYFTNARVYANVIGLLANGTETLDSVTGRGNVTTNGITVNNANANFIALNTTAGYSVTQGQIAWNAADLTFDMGMANGVTLQVGQEQYIKVKAGSNISDGQAVMFAGADGEHVIAVPNDVTTPGYIPEWFIGVATQDLSMNAFGYVTTFGKVHNLNTLAWSEGDILYVDPLTVGGLVNVEPQAPYPNIIVAAVTKRAGGDGHLLVRPTWRPSLHQLNDVAINGAVHGQSLVFDGGNVWRNQWLTTANVTENTNLYYTDTRARAAISVSGAGSYDSSTGIITINTSSSSYGDANVYTNVIQLGYITSSALNGYATNSQVSALATTANLVLKANIADLTTANVTEITNLYFTNARVYSNVTSLGYITSSSLSGYATNAQLASYATNAQLAIYATNAQLSSYATTTNVALKANVVDLTTANVTEVTNLYFTNARVYSNVTSLGYITSSSLSGYATNSQLTSYATTSNLALKANVVDLTTANVTEDTNLYFTNERVISALDVGVADVSVISRGINHYGSLAWFTDTEILGQPFESQVIVDEFGVTVVSSTGTSGARLPKEWNFGSDGLLQFPDTTFQTTAFTPEAVYANVITLGYAKTSSLTTANVTEVSNLYFTNTRVYSNITQLGYITSSSLNGYATNSQLTSYATTANLALKANIADLTTANIAEVTNLYYNNARVYANVITLGYAKTANLTTANTVELNNLYFTNTRAVTAITDTALSNITIGGIANVIYQPATAVGSAIQITAANTKGGTGYADFLKVTNSSGGATSPNKYFRITSDGRLEIINSAYNSGLLSFTDGGDLTIIGKYQVNGKQAVNGPAFSAYAEAILQTIPTDAQTKVLFQTEEYDTNGCYSSSRFTPNVEGYYQLNAEVRLDGSSGTGEMMIAIWKNGSEYKRGTNQRGTEIAANFWAQQVSSIVYANGTTDYFEIYVQHGAGASRTVTAVNSPAITWFNGCMVRGA